MEALLDLHMMSYRERMSVNELLLDLSLTKHLPMDPSDAERTMQIDTAYTLPWRPLFYRKVKASAIEMPRTRSRAI
jgi:hypothetical protein